MALPLPVLDDRTYAELADEARALIPGLAPAWTDHNPSDPGITLVELFAWLVEMQHFRADQVPPEHTRAFLSLLNGPDWTGTGDLDDDVASTISDLRTRYRAVTAGDFEQLALADFNRLLASARHAERSATDEAPAESSPALAEWWAQTGLSPALDVLPSAVPAVLRAHLVARRDLDGDSETDRSQPAPAHVSLVVVSADEPAEPLGMPDTPGPAALRRALWQYLDPRRTLGTRHHVVSPLYVPIRVEALLALRPDLPDLDVADDEGWAHLAVADPRRAVEPVLRRFLDPVRGGPDGSGWPLGRSVYLSEIYDLLGSLPGVAYVVDVVLTSTCGDGGRCVTAEPSWNDDGEMVGMALRPHQLPTLRFSPGDVRTARGFVPVSAKVELAAAPGTPLPEVFGAIRDLVRRAFPPFVAGAENTATEVRAATLERAVRAVPGVLGPVHVTLTADESRLVYGKSGRVLAVALVQGEMAEVSVEVEADLLPGADDGG